MPAKKSSSITDVALRLFLSDLLDRGQIRPGNLGRALGYRDSTEVSKFLKGNINFSKKRVASAIETLVAKFNANKTFLETGHGAIYQNNKPYMANDKENQFHFSDSNIASYYSKRQIKELEEIAKKLQERIDHLEQLIKAKEETIQLQRELLAKKKK